MASASKRQRSASTDRTPRSNIRSTITGRSSSAGRQMSSAPRSARSSVGVRNSMSAASGGSVVRSRQLSGVPSGRVSDMIPQRKTAVTKDPRGFEDTKSFAFADAISKLSNFLIDYNFPRRVELTPKVVPSASDVKAIFEMIFQDLSKNLTLDSKRPEESIVQTLKSLGYPFSISPSHLKSLGAPRAWPMALGALIWLMEGLEYGSSALEIVDMPVQGFDAMEQEFQDDYTPGECDLLFQLSEDTYNRFLQGDSCFEDENDVLTENLEAMHMKQLIGTPSSDTKEESSTMRSRLHQENSDLLEQRAKLDCELGVMDALKNDIDEREAGIKQFDDYLSLIKTTKDDLRNRTEAILKSVEEQKSQLKDIETRNKQLQTECENQILSQADIQAMHRNMNEKKRILAETGKTLNEIEDRCDEEEIKVSSSQQQIIEHVRAYNTKARELKMISDDSQLDGDFHFTFKFGDSAEHVRDKLLPNLRRFRTQLIDAVSEKQKQNVTNQHTLSEMSELESQTTRQIDETGSSLAECKQQIEQFKQRAEVDLVSAAEKLKTVKNDLERTKSNFQQRLDGLKQRLATSEQRRDQSRVEGAETIALTERFLDNFADEVLNFRNAMQELSGKMYADAERRLDEMKALSADLEKYLSSDTKTLTPALQRLLNDFPPENDS